MPCPRLVVPVLGAFLLALSLPALAAPPMAPAYLTVDEEGAANYLYWTNPTTRSDGSALTNFGGIHVYRNDVLIATLTRPIGAAGNHDSYRDQLPGSELLKYQVSAFDRSTPPQVSALSMPVYTGGSINSPRLEFSPSSLDLQAAYAGTATGGLTLTNSGGGNLFYTIYSDEPWLTVNNSNSLSGTLIPGQIMGVNVRASGFAVGSHAATFTINSNDSTGSTRIVPVTLTVSPPSPNLGVSTSSVSFLLLPGGSGSKSMRVWNRGTTLGTFSLSGQDSWLSASPVSGVVSPNQVVWVQLTASAAGLAAGVYHDTLHVETSDPAAPLRQVRIHLTVFETACGFSPAVFQISRPWNAAPETLQVTFWNPSCGDWIASTETGASWLSMPTGFINEGGGYETVPLRLDARSLPPGAHLGVMWIRMPNYSQQSLVVELTVVSTPPRISVVPGEVTFHRPEGSGATSGALLMLNEGYQSLRAHITEGAAWLRPLDPDLVIGAGGVATVPIEVNAEALSPGVYTERLRITSNDPESPEIEVPVTFRVLPAVTDVSPTLLAMDELFLRCSDGDSTTQYVELRPPANTTFRSTIGLRIEDGAGDVVYEATGLFPGRADGDPWDSSTTWLIATPALEVTGLAPDLTATRLFPLDGGTATLYDGDIGNVLHRFSYGTRSVRQALPPGYSYQWFSGNMVEKELPDLANAGGESIFSFGCPCPAAALLADRTSFYRTGPAFDSTFTIYGSARLAYDLPQGTFHAEGHGEAASVNVREPFSIHGIPAGVPIAFRARLHVIGSAWYRTNEFGIPYSGAMSAELKDDSSQVSGLQLRTSAYGGSGGVNRALELTLTRRSGEIFFLNIRGAGSGDSHGYSIGGGGTFDGRLEFFGLPPGATIRSCRGFGQEEPVPLALALDGVDASAGEVRIRWLGGQGMAEVGVERNDGETWSVLTSVRPTVDGEIVVTDRSVQPGRRYGYRLRSEDETTSEVWVTVPSIIDSPRMTSRYHADSHRIAVSLTLPVSGNVTLELIDVAGRRVERKDLGLMEAGDHQQSFDRRLASGLYFVRLVAGGRAMTARVMVVR